MACPATATNSGSTTYNITVPAGQMFVGKGLISTIGLSYNTVCPFSPGASQAISEFLVVTTASTFNAPSVASFYCVCIGNAGTIFSNSCVVYPSQIFGFFEDIN